MHIRFCCPLKGSYFVTLDTSLQVWQQREAAFFPSVVAFARVLQVFQVNTVRPATFYYYVSDVNVSEKCANEAFAEQCHLSTLVSCY